MAGQGLMAKSRRGCRAPVPLTGSSQFSCLQAKEMPPTRKLARLFHVGRGGLAPDEVGVGRIGQAARDGQLRQALGRGQRARHAGEVRGAPSAGDRQQARACLKAHAPAPSTAGTAGTTHFGRAP